MSDGRPDFFDVGTTILLAQRAGIIPDDKEDLSLDDVCRLQQELACRGWKWVAIGPRVQEPLTDVRGWLTTLCSFGCGAWLPPGDGRFADHHVCASCREQEVGLQDELSALRNQRRPPRTRKMKEDAGDDHPFDRSED